MSARSTLPQRKRVVLAVGYGRCQSYVHVGSGIGGFEVIEREHTRLIKGGPSRVSPFFITASIAKPRSGSDCDSTRRNGPNLACATACTIGAHDIGEAFRILQRGEADVMIAGAAEAAVTPLSIVGFTPMKALSTRSDDPEHASRPWDAARDGFVTGEGAGILILERLKHALACDAPILAKIIGYAANADAFHANAPPEDGAESSGLWNLPSSMLRSLHWKSHT